MWLSDWKLNEKCIIDLSLYRTLLVVLIPCVLPSTKKGVSSFFLSLFTLSLFFNFSLDIHKKKAFIDCFFTLSPLLVVSVCFHTTNNKPMMIYCVILSITKRLFTKKKKVTALYLVPFFTGVPIIMHTTHTDM